MAKRGLIEAEVVPEKEPQIERHEITSSQKCQLTKDEILQQGEVMAGAQKEVTEAENELNSIKKQFQARIETATCQMNRAANLIRDKFEYRNVKCERIFNYDAGTVTEWRRDTNETIANREMTEDEKQTKLALEA